MARRLRRDFRRGVGIDRGPPAVALFRFQRNVIHVIAACRALDPIAKFLPA
jgi:hypothetical protein